MTKTITIRLDEEVITKLKEIAKADLRSVGKTIEFLVREHLSREESIEKYYEHEKKYIDHAMRQEGKALSFVDVFHD